MCPINISALQPGDLVLCYGVNPVAHLQRTVKTLGRIGTVLTGGTIQALKMALGDPIQPFSGTADCNHALIVGSPDWVSQDVGGTKIEIEVIHPGERCIGFRKVDERLMLEFVKRGLQVSRSADMTAVVASYGGRDNLSTSCAEGLFIEQPTQTTSGKVSLVLKKMQPFPVPRLCHSTGGGCIWDTAAEYFGLNVGRYRVFRLKGGGDLASTAGRVAKKWAAHKRGQDPAGSHYSKWKAFKGSMGSHIYGPSARSRAANFRKHRDRLGGPPSSSIFGGGENTHKDWFCSYFVVACYHAATEFDAEAATYLPLDGRHTSPMTLDAFLSQSTHWTKVAEEGLTGSPCRQPPASAAWAAPSPTATGALWRGRTDRAPSNFFGFIARRIG